MGPQIDLTEKSENVAAKPWLRTIVIIAGCYVALHLILCFTFDYNNPQAFLRGDRSINRMRTTTEIVNCKSWEGFTHLLLQKGLPGDYLWQAGIYWVFRNLPQPRLAVILVQILLSGFSIFLVGLIANMLCANRRVIIASTTLYALLPHTSVFPHMFVSEAFFVPLGIISIYQSILYFKENGSINRLILSALFWTLCSLTRPTALLFPFLMFAILILKSRHLWFRHCLLLASFLLLISFWVVPSMLLIGSPNISNTGDAHGLNRLLHSKSETLVAMLSKEQQCRETDWLDSIPKDNFTLVDAARIHLRHPLKFSILLAIESAKLILKFDETKVLNYLGIWSVEGHWPRDWEKILDLNPFVFLEKDLPVILLMLFFGLFWTLFVVAAVYGIVALSKGMNYNFLLVACFIIYSLSVCQITDTMQARLRFPVDFAICIFGMYGGILFFDRYLTKRALFLRVGSNR